MIRLKKRDIKKALKDGAKAGSISLADVRADIEATIDEAMNSTDPDVQANFRKYFEKPVYLSRWLIGMNRFGASAPYSKLFPYFGFTVENVVARVKAL